MYSKSIETEAVFTKKEINNEENINLSSKNKMSSKSIETEAVFTKTEINNEENINFLRKTR